MSRKPNASINAKPTDPISFGLKVTDEDDCRTIRKYCTDHKLTSSQLLRTAIGKIVNRALVEPEGAGGAVQIYDVLGASTVAARLKSYHDRLCGALAGAGKMEELGRMVAEYKAIDLTVSLGRATALTALNGFADQAGVKKLENAILIPSTKPSAE